MNKLITTSIDCKESAKRIANQILSDRLSPCVQIINNINSFYIWNNQIEESIEFLIIIKCIHENQNDITSLILKSHTYDVPEIIVSDFNILNRDYQNWFSKNSN
tara:strand:+ start:1471 stop:1782 length:312 start_codon:yes stop_codon:yes gene_type:complete